jgi:hypothetical protein
MRDWHELFKAWAKPPSETEEEEGSRAATMVNDAVRETGNLAGRTFSIYPMGSYRNNTNIRLGSDVDIALVLHVLLGLDPPGLGLDVVAARARCAGHHSARLDLDEPPIRGRCAVIQGLSASATGVPRIDALPVRGMRAPHRICHRDGGAHPRLLDYVGEHYVGWRRGHDRPCAKRELLREHPGKAVGGAGQFASRPSPVAVALEHERGVGDQCL